MLKKALLCVLCALMLCFAARPAALADGWGCPYMYVDTGNAGSLHLRACPDCASESLGLYCSGTQVLVQGYANSCWAAVQVDGRQGYMNTSYLSARQPAVRQQVIGMSAGALKPMYVATACGSLHLRAYASQNAQSLGLYPNGTLVYAADLGNGWSAVLAGGLYGCMMTQYLSPSPSNVRYSCAPAPTASPYACQYSAPIRQDTSWYCQPASVCTGTYVTVRNPNSSFVYLRSSRDADRRDNILAKVPVGTQLLLLESGRYWSRVSLDGAEGYMVSAYLN